MTTKVASETYRNANGKERDVFVNGTSVIRIIAERAPKMSKVRINRELMICLIRSTSIPIDSYFAS
jgi:hypothetical protein